MFRILFFICFITLLFFGFFNIFSPLSTGLTDKTNLDYEALVKNALERNTSPKTLTEVLVIPELILGAEYYDSNKTPSPRKSYFTNSEFNIKQNNLQGINTTNSNPLSGNVSIPKAEFSVLGMNTSNDSGNYGLSGNDECNGIFFSPCIKVGSFDTTLGSYKLKESGTPIHTKINEVSL